MRPRAALALIPLVVVGVTAAGCGGAGGGQTVQADGSSTVGPLVTAAAERYREADGTNVTVGISGTGGGFERFCKGETDLSNASRPIKDEESEICAQNDVEYVELQVANDALTVVVNPENDWATCLTVDELKRIWEPGSKIENWSEIRDGFPDEPLLLYGAGTDSGTFDYFTDVIVGEEGASRADYNASEDDNVTVQGVKGDTGALGYFGFSYYEENLDSLRAVEIDGGDGCVAPSSDAAQAGDYKPLARPLFVYARTTALGRQEVAGFLRYLLENQAEIAEQAQFVPLSDTQATDQLAALSEATGS